MNMVVRELGKMPTLQSFLVLMLEYVQEYFKSATHPSEQRIYAALNKIFAKISLQFPSLFAICSVSKKLLANVQEKVGEKSVRNSSGGKCKHIGLKTFIHNIEDDRSAFQEAREGRTEQQAMLTWVKSVLLEEIASLREEIMDAEANFGNTLEASLQAIACTSSDLGINGKAYVVFLDSYLSNGMACAKISQFKIVTVLPFEAKESAAGQIAMVDAAQHIHNSKMVLISADVILKNGGILCRSGSLLLCRIANMCNVPVFALSRSYCHSDELISTQKALLKRENPLNYFAVDESQFNSFKVHVGKASDYIEPKLLRGLITEQGLVPNSAAQLYESY